MKTLPPKLPAVDKAQPAASPIKATPPKLPAVNKPSGREEKSRDRNADDRTSGRSNVALKKEGSSANMLLVFGALGGVGLLGLLVVCGTAGYFILRTSKVAGLPQNANGVAEVAGQPAAKPVLAAENAKPPAQKFNLEEVRKSVVFLRVFVPGLPPSSGSGFFVTQDGLIATNRHVVEGEDGLPAGAKIMVGVPRPTEPDTMDYYPAEHAFSPARNDPTDFALLKITAAPNRPPFRPLPLLARDSVPLGTDVAALGYPFAVADDDKVAVSFTKGSISSVKVALDGKSYYQTDAAVNPGNSGGPLINANGEVVGIVSAVRKNADNIGYALYLGETNLRTLPVENFAKLRPAPGPVGPNDRPTLRTVAAKRANWNLERGMAKEVKNAIVLHGDTAGSSFWVTSNDALRENFQVSFVTVIVTPDGAGKGGAMPNFPIGPGIRPGFPRFPRGAVAPRIVRPPTTANALLAIRLTTAPTKTDIMAGDGLTFMQTTQNLVVRANRQSSAQAPVANADGVFVVTLMKSGDTVSYFVNGKEQMRTTMPAGAAGDLSLSIGGTRGLVLLTDLYVEQYNAPIALGAPPPNQFVPPTANNNPGQPQQEKKPNVEFAGRDGATKILGGAFDPQFKDQAPSGSLLAGLELGVVNNNSIKSVRPIYRDANEQETNGKQYGKQPTSVVTLKAKAGYAVGTVTVNAGLWIDGMSVTFMRIKGGELDAGDSYQSEFVGGTGGGRTVLGGNGTPVIGIVGKANRANDCTGFGLLLKKPG